MISLVLYGRNDSYGYNLHKRAAISLNCMAEVLTAPGDEILFVDYNTPDDFPTFPEAIQDTLTAKAKSLLRIFRVRPSQHERFRERTRLLALEPIARNVAIRRSNAENSWILSTNTDMVFVPRKGSSLSEIVAHLDDAYYGLPRFEVPETLWESTNRLDPVGTIAAFEAWGRAFHLNEIVYSSSSLVRYDAPGDFQLMLRSDLWRMSGFHESMLLGWHVDSNMAKRLALLPRRMGEIVDDVFGYHCDHTRQVTPAHGPRAAANDLGTFFEDVEAADVPEQAETWGLASEYVEELRVDATSRAYLSALTSQVVEPLREPSELSYSVESFNFVDYSIDRVLPFLVDIFASYRRDTTLGWLGTKDGLLDRFAKTWQAMGFTQPILVSRAAHQLLKPLPDGCAAAGEQEIDARCDVLLFDWGRPQESFDPDWDFKSDPEIKRVLNGFMRLARSERTRLKGSGLPGRRFVGVNAINNDVERLFNEHVGAARTPIATRIRQGYVTPMRERQELLPLMSVGGAGKKVGDTIAAVDGRVGFVFYGPYIAVDSGAHRLRVEFEADVSGDAVPGLGIQVLSNGCLIAYRELRADDLQSGSVSIDFVFPEEVSGDDWPSTEFRLWTLGQTPFTVRRVLLESIDAAEALTQADFDLTMLVSAGSAGVRHTSGDGHEIRAVPAQEGGLCFGPYVWLLPGRYEVTFRLMLHGPNAAGTIRLYATAELGARVLAEGAVAGQNAGEATAVISFEIAEAAPSHDRGLLEFQVWTLGSCDVSLVGLSVRREVALNFVTPVVSEDERALGAYGLTPSLLPGPAGRRFPGSIISTPEPGDVFVSPPLDLVSGTYRAIAEVEPLDARTLAGDSTLAMVVTEDSALMAFREYAAVDARAGTLSLPFTVSGGSGSVKLKLRTNGASSFIVRSVRVEEAEANAASAVDDVDCSSLLIAGTAAAVSRFGGSTGGFALLAKAGVAGNVAYGPYLALPPGRYEVGFGFQIPLGVDQVSIEVDVAAGLGTQVLARATAAPARRGRLKRLLGQRWMRLEHSLAFEIPESVTGDLPLVEFRVWTGGGFEFYLTTVRLRKVATAPYAFEPTATASP